MKYWKERILVIFFIFILSGLYSQYSDSSYQFLSSANFLDDTVCRYENLISFYDLDSYEDAVSLVQQYVDTALLSNDSTRLANMLLILGIIQENKGDNSDAFETLLEAYTIFKTNHNQIGIALTMDHLGILFRYYGSQKKSLEYHTKAYEIFNQGKYTFGLINVLNNLGIINRQLGNDEVALNYLKQALSLAIDNNSSNLSSIYISIGTNYWYKGVNDSALYYYKRALNIPPDNLPLKERHCAGLNNIGNVYRSIQQYDSALYYYNMAIKESRLYGTKNLESINLKNLGRVYSLLGQYDKAFDLFQSSLQIAIEINLKKVILENYYWVGELFEKQHNYKQALVYFKKHSDIENSILAEKQLAEINQLEHDFSLEQSAKEEALKLKEDSEQNLLIERKRTNEIIYIALVFILLSSSLFIFFQYKTKKKSNLLLRQLNEELEIKIEDRTKSLVEAKEKAEEGKKALNHSHDLMKYIIEHNRSAVAVHDKNFKYIYVSQRYLQDYNVKEKDIIGRHHYDVFPDLPQKWRDVHKKALSGEVSSAEDDPYYKEDGTTEWTRWECRPWYETDETIGGFIVYTEVITQRKNMELALKKAKEKAEESDRLKSAFLANMSHEIRTPMNGILGFANLLKSTKLGTEQQQKYISIIEKGGERLLNTINEIIDISKIESGQMSTTLSTVNVNDCLDELYGFFKLDAEKRGVELKLTKILTNKQARIKTDLEKLNSILTNLIKNALKYTNIGTIKFGYNLNKTKTEVEFYITDTGIGIPHDRQTAIFERFIQADIEDRMAHQGAGLGLAISKAYVEMLGGKIWVKSDPNIGSTFYFTQPYFKEESSDVPSSNIAKTKTVPTKIIKILITDDDETSTQLLETIVGSFAKEIIKVKTGKDAIAACKNNDDIDLVLMDIRMPEMNGCEATKKIREFNKNIIIIAQTAYALAGDRENSIEAGCNDYISKPIIKKELLEKIEKCLSSQ